MVLALIYHSHFITKIISKDLGSKIEQIERTEAHSTMLSYLSNLLDSTSHI